MMLRESRAATWDAGRGGGCSVAAGGCACSRGGGGGGGPRDVDAFLAAAFHDEPATLQSADCYAGRRHGNLQRLRDGGDLGFPVGFNMRENRPRGGRARGRDLP